MVQREDHSLRGPPCWQLVLLGRASDDNEIEGVRNDHKREDEETSAGIMTEVFFRFLREEVNTNH